MATHRVSVVMPYRLDLTATVLRRLSTNAVDVLTQEGVYVRALSGFDQPVIVRVTQSSPRSLSVSIDGDGRHEAAALQAVRTILGVDRDVSSFAKAAARIRWLAPLVERMRGVKPPRYPSLWEACVNSIVFQQLSLRAASAIMQRMIVALGRRVRVDRVATPIYVFPSAERIRRASDTPLRSAGLSGNKIAALRRVSEALASGALDARAIEALPSPEAASVLQRIKGIGPWTAVLILLRGLGRLDVFPGSDSSVMSNLALVAGSRGRLDMDRVLDALGAQRGMLYYHLLLARLEARGEIRGAFAGSARG